jgi:hypothetical protein
MMDKESYVDYCARRASELRGELAEYLIWYKESCESGEYMRLPVKVRLMLIRGELETENKISEMERELEKKKTSEFL